MAPSISTGIDIAAPPIAVWAVLTDYDRYPEWNPFLVKMSGDKKGRHDFQPRYPDILTQRASPLERAPPGYALALYRPPSPHPPSYRDWHQIRAVGTILGYSGVGAVLDWFQHV
ncbi:MAG: hypothetical protein Q9175_003523 [Cornicularia normoerica]